MVIPRDVWNRLSTAPHATKYIFSGNGTNSYQRISRTFKAILEDSQLPMLSLHSSRHTACTLMLARGMNLKLVSAMMGHNSTSFTLDRYTHLVPQFSEGIDIELQSIFFGSDASDTLETPPHLGPVLNAPN